MKYGVVNLPALLLQKWDTSQRHFQLDDFAGGDAARGDFGCQSFKVADIPQQHFGFQPFGFVVDEAFCDLKPFIDFLR